MANDTPPLLPRRRALSSHELLFKLCHGRGGPLGALRGAHAGAVARGPRACCRNVARRVLCLRSYLRLRWLRRCLRTTCTLSTRNKATRVVETPFLWITTLPHGSYGDGWRCRRKKQGLRWFFLAKWLREEYERFLSFRRACGRDEISPPDSV